MSNELNEFLTAKGVSTHLKVKRSLAQAFGLPMDNGTEEQQGAVLRALKTGVMGAFGETKETYRVETAFDKLTTTIFDNYNEALTESKKITERGFTCRIVIVTTITFPI